MNIISFSLWGNDKLYCQGALENIECAKIYYPDWKCRFYVEESCPALPDLMKKDCEVITVKNTHNTQAIDRTQNAQYWHNDYNHIGMLWRFEAIDDPDVENVIFRDCDSRVGPRDAHAVTEWLGWSDCVMHRMHECKEHWNAQVMGGMWGVRAQYMDGIKKCMTDYVNRYKKIRNEPWVFVDLWWIMDYLWPILKNSCMGHGYGHPNHFKVDGPMVGSVVNEEWRGQQYARS